jgi:ABC-type transport system involved in cytochrome bd biosynthesis fused ATPase/permease subunit
MLARRVVDVVAGLPPVTAYGRAAAQARTIRDMTERCPAGETLRTGFRCALVLELVSTLSAVLVVVAIGVRLLGGDPDLRVVLLVLILAPEAYLPWRAVAAGFRAGEEGLAAAGRAFGAHLDTASP